MIMAREPDGNWYSLCSSVKCFIIFEVEPSTLDTHVNLFSFSQRAHKLHSLYLGRPSQLKMFPQLCIEKLRTGWMVRSLHAAVGWFIQFQFLFYWCYSNRCITCYFNIVTFFILQASLGTRLMAAPISRVPRLIASSVLRIYYYLL